MTNSRRRKDRKEYERGMTAMLEGRNRQPNERRPDFGAYHEGAMAGAAILAERKREAEHDARTSD